MGSAYQFHSWRVFVLVCAFPSVFAIGALTTMPESPRFFLEVSWGAGSPGTPAGPRPGWRLRREPRSADDPPLPCRTGSTTRPGWC